MSFLPEIREGNIVEKKAPVKYVYGPVHRKGKGAKRKERILGKKLWREYYKSIEFIKHLGCG